MDENWRARSIAHHSKRRLMRSPGRTDIESCSARNTFQCLKERERSTRPQVMGKKTSRSACNTDCPPSHQLTRQVASPMKLENTRVSLSEMRTERSSKISRPRTSSGKRKQSSTRTLTAGDAKQPSSFEQQTNGLSKSPPSRKTC